MLFGRPTLMMHTKRGLIGDYLLVAPGGGGETGVQFNANAGGGGGGEVLIGNNINFGSSTVYNIVIGNFGIAGVSQGDNGTDATNSTFIGGIINLTARGGHGGGGVASNYGLGGVSGNLFPGSGPPNGHGGGAGGPAVTGNPGPGLLSTINGVSLEYGRGGPSGSANSANAGTGGQGGTGNPVSAGTNGRGGLFIVRYLGSQNATGGIISQFGGYTIHTFATSGTFTVN